MLIDSGMPRSATAPAQLALDRAIAAETGRSRDDEHQLWYVALTHARYAALIVVSDPDGGASPVTRAIIESADPRLTAASNPIEAWLELVPETVPCPSCRPGTGRLRRMRSQTRHFAGCTNWNGGEGCDYTQPPAMPAASACWWRSPAGSSSAPTRRAGRSSRAAAAGLRDLWWYGVRRVQRSVSGAAGGTARPTPAAARGPSAEPCRGQKQTEGGRGPRVHHGNSIGADAPSAPSSCERCRGGWERPPGADGPTWTKGSAPRWWCRAPVSVTPVSLSSPAGDCYPRMGSLASPIHRETPIIMPPVEPMRQDPAHSPLLGESRPGLHLAPSARQTLACRLG